MMEELVADLSAAFLCANLGLIPEPRQEAAVCIQSWLKVFKGDKHAIFTTAGHAQRAIGFLHHTVEKALARLVEPYERQSVEERRLDSDNRQRLF